VTERKPPGVEWQSWIERQLDEGRREGMLDNLEGSGKPIPGLGEPRDDDWWVKEKLRREGVNWVPPTLAIRAERDAAVAEAEAADSEDELRAVIERINERIRYVNSHTVSGPPTTVWTVDPEPIVERWRANQPEVPASDALVPDTATPPAASSSQGLRRLFRRS
jgi:hypothetical protein